MQSIEFSLSVMIVKLNRYDVFFITVVIVLNFTISSHSKLLFFKAALAENTLY